MHIKKKLALPLVGLGLVAAIGIVAGLAFSRGSDSEGVPQGARVAAPAPTQATPAATTQPPTPAVESESPQALPAGTTAERPVEPVREGATKTAAEPDPDYAAALRRARISTRGWKTDFSRHSVAYEDFLGGGPPKDGIPAIDSPSFVTVAQAEQWLEDREPVQAVEINGDARAYPIQILMWHEIVNDVVGGEPIGISY